MRVRQFLILVILFCGELKAAPERDWVNIDDWANQTLPGTEKIPLIDVADIENYSVWVTYAQDGGRFGDQITNYLKALWISWKYDTPLVFRPFEYSNELVLGDFHPTLLDDALLQEFSAKLEYFTVFELEKSEKVFQYLETMPDHQEPAKQRLLWNIGLLTPFIEEHFCEKLDDERFRELLQILIKPNEPLKLVSLPEDRKTIAIHMRSGVGYDWESNIRNMPTKFVPDTFYYGCLKQALMMFHDAPVFVHIFTDHPEPEVLEAKLLAEVESWRVEKDILINCRRVGNFHADNVLEDFFSMMEFDCIIHPDSSLSQSASIIAGPLLEMRPSHWGEYRTDEKGNPIYDKNGKVIVDPLVVQRLERGKAIERMWIAPIESSMLFNDTEVD